MTPAAGRTLPDLPWWRRAVFYEVYPRSFQDANGDGVGDLAAIIRRLDYLADLGVDAVWITPFYPSPQVDFGYDISDYCAVDPQFGTLADFDRLLAEAHKRGLRIVLDIVLNHTSDQHPWFQESRASRDNSKRDWYIWRDQKPDGSPPNNWSSAFGPCAWAFDERTGQYYYHFFYPEQPDLNWRNPEVEQAMFDMVRFWIERGADGFRLDALQTIYEDEALRDNPLLETPRASTISVRNQDWVYNNDQPETYEMLRRLRRFVDALNPECVLIGEGVCASFDKLIPYYGLNGDAVQLPFNFFFTLLPRLDATAFRDQVECMEGALGDNWTTYVLSNHDIPRAFDRLGGGQHAERIARLQATMLLTLRGAPFIYYGEEIGMLTTPPTRIEDVQDPVGRRFWPRLKGRDGARTPMQWDASPNAGFTSGKPWLPIPSSARRRNVAAQHDDPRSLLSFYRDLLRLRRASPALLDGDYSSIGRSPSVFAYTRRAPGQTIVVALNMSGEQAGLSLTGAVPGARRLRRLIGNVRAPSAILTDGEVILRPYEASVWEAQPG